MKRAKRWLALVLCLLCCPLFTACNTLTVKEYKVPTDKGNLDSGIIAQNATYELEWDDALGCVLLRNKQSDHIWSTTPYSTYLEGVGDSALMIEYYNLTDFSVQTEESDVCMSEGTCFSEKIDNGVRVTYYFTFPEITVPVEYTLEENGLRATVRADEVEESGSTKLISISLLPYFCAAEKVDDRSAYLFVPTGSGALMYTDDDLTRAGRTYSGEVYGTDGSRAQLDVIENEEAITLPVFGAKAKDDNALFAIIDQGAESARIEATAGSSRLDFSRAYASFLYRGYDEVEQTIGKQRWDTLALAEGAASGAIYSVCYYPLVGKQANYNGMATFYREYLDANGYLQQSSSTQEAYHVELLGGAEITDLFLGVPYTTLHPLTSYKQAQTMLEELIKTTGKKPAVLLHGYGKSGVNIGKLAGGFSLSNKMGSPAQRNALTAFLDDHVGSYFFNYEPVYFSRSGNGFTTSFSTAKTANLQSAASHPLKINIRMPNEEADKVHLIKRSLLPKVVDKVLANKVPGGVGLGSLGSVAYSDYFEEATYVKEGTEEQIKAILETVKDSNRLVALQSANGYAAGLADSVSDVPVENGGYTSFDVSIPFYQMVFRGYTPLYTVPLNYTDGHENLLLKAVEAGVSPSFALIADRSAEVAGSTIEYFYAAEYATKRDMVEQVVADTGAYYTALGNAKIAAHHLHGDSVTETVYDNGVSVLVNHGDTPQTVNGHTIQPQSFVMTK